MRTVRVIAPVCLATALTWRVAHAEPTRPAPIAVVGGALAGDPVPRSTYMIFPADRAGSVPALPSAIAHAAPTVIYMNRMGGTFYPGNNDARTNRSSIPSTTSRINPWNVSDAGWQQVMTCIRDQFARFNVQITDVDPGNVPHIESVVAGSPQNVGMQQGVGGVSPFTSDCSVIPNSIVFTFAEVYGNSYRAVCETAAQEISHSFGLDHEYECKDPMTYLSGCGAKSFQNLAARCGEYSARTCQCGGATQNSVAMLTARLGTANQPPTVAITQPTSGAQVMPGFAVAVNASDTGAVARVELYIDGALAATDTAAPWTFTTPATLPAGAHTLEARAYDDGAATATSSVTVTVVTPPNGGGGGGGGDAGTGGGGGGGGGGAGDADAGVGGDDGDGDPSTPDDGRPGEVTGGCAAGGGAGATLGLLLAAGLVAVGRRRRR